MKTNLMGKTFEYENDADLKKQIQAHHDKLTERYSATVLGVKKVEITVEDVPTSESSSQVLQQVLGDDTITPPEPTGTEGDVTDPVKTEGQESQESTEGAPSETTVEGAPVVTETTPEPAPEVVTDPVTTEPEVKDTVVETPVADTAPVVDTPAATTPTTSKKKTGNK